MSNNNSNKELELSVAAPPGDALDRIQQAVDAASDERYQSLREWERLAERWKNEGDMYGWNFHQGMVAGANYVDIYYHRITREIEAIRKAASSPVTPSPTPLIDAVQEIVEAEGGPTPIRKHAPAATQPAAKLAAEEIVRDQGIWHLFDRSSDPVMAHERLIDRLTAIIERHFPVQPVEEQKDGWVTFGRVKVDIENETETFERIEPE